MSFNHGAKRQDNINKLLKVAMSSAVLGGLVFVVVLNVYPYQFVSVFNSTDQELIEGAILGIRLHMFALFHSR